ncbi:MAG TPA: RluA family pseudouridine synthase [Chromatiaceae bacterium]|nr:RluA family pseudouridine synthase [Chromatiaceae bacterium]
MKDKQTVLERHVEVKTEDIKAVDLLANESGLSRGRIKRTMKNGAVWVEREKHVQRLRRADRKLRRGDILHLYYDANIQAVSPPAAVLVKDEGEYSVWFKPAGMFSQGSKWGDQCTIVRWAEQHLQPQRNAFVVHRLDRSASGLMLLAHGKQSAAGLSALFRERRLEKHYRVNVQGRFPGDLKLLDQPLDGRPALSHVRLMAVDPHAGRSLLGVRIYTGRKHQIRRHLSNLGFPVVGDRLYGGGDDDDLQLQAVRLVFSCPVTGQHRDYRLPEELLIGQASGRPGKA